MWVRNKGKTESESCFLLIEKRREPSLLRLDVTSRAGVWPLVKLWRDNPGG
jgi:hypothetical protein